MVRNSRVRGVLFALILAAGLLPAVSAEICETVVDEEGCTITTCVDETTGEITSEDIDCPAAEELIEEVTSGMASGSGGGDESSENASGESGEEEEETGEEGEEATEEETGEEEVDEEGEEADFDEEEELEDEEEVVDEEEITADNLVRLARFRRGCLAKGGRVVLTTFVRAGERFNKLRCVVRRRRVVEPIGSQIERIKEEQEEDVISEEEMPAENITAFNKARRACLARGGRVVTSTFTRENRLIRTVRCVKLEPLGQAVSTAAQEIADRAQDIQERIRECRNKGGFPEVVDDTDQYGRIVKRVICKGVEEEQVIAEAPQPVNCRIVVDEQTGFKRRICTTAAGGGVATPVRPVVTAAARAGCPEIDTEKITGCREAGGRPTRVMGDDGCLYIECKMEEEMPLVRQQCPSMEEVDERLRKCKEMGMEARIERDFNGCKHAVCVERKPQKEPLCPEIDGERIRQIVEECERRGGKPVRKFGENGCQLEPICVEPGQECEPVPEEAFEKCEAEGGKLVVKEDENGCPVFTKCVKRGEYEGINPEDVNEVPDSTKLLGVALKLEELRMSFDRLARKTAGIADYYEETGDEANADKFRRVSKMFETGKGRIDDLKIKIRDNARDMSMEEFQEMRERIRFLKEVLLENILYVMLTDPSEVAETIDCGTSGECFSKALMVCQPASFTPDFEGADVQIDIIGTNDEGECEFTATMADDEGTYDMTCGLPDYAFGILREERLPELCEGSMVDKLEELSESQEEVME